MISCIYVIENTVNGRKYIGSTLDFKSRISKHMYLLRKNKHDNEFLQNSFNKHGEKNFKAYVLLEVNADSREELDELLVKEEERLIFEHKTLYCDDGYNIELPTRTSVSDYTRKKISDSLIGKKWDEDRYKNINNAYSKKLQLEDAINIRQLKERGVSKKDICRIYNISDRTYYYVISNTYHKEYN